MQLVHNPRSQRVSGVKCLKGNKGDSFHGPPFGENLKGDTEPFSFASQIVSPNPSAGTRTIPPDRRHDFLASSLWGFQRLTSRRGQNDLQSQERCCYCSEKYLQKKSPEVGAGWKDGNYFFFKQKNIFVFASLKFGGGSSSPSDHPGRSKAMFVLGRSGGEGFPLQRDSRAGWPW